MPFARVRCAAILAGGLGTRLRPVLPGQQKVVAEVAGVPFLVHVIRHLAAQGITEVILLVGHRADQVKALLDPHDGYPIRLSYSTEPRPMGTAGALRHAAHLLPPGPFFVLNGDTYFPVPLHEVITVQRRRGGVGTIGLTRVERAADYGRVEVDPAGRVVAFHEKDASFAGPALASGGLYLLTHEILEFVPRAGPVSLERDVFPAILAAGRRLNGYVSSVPAHDIGTPDRYAVTGSILFGER